PVDLGAANGRTFLGIASLGFDSDANRIANEAPPQLGRLVYVYGAMRALAAWRPAEFTVDVDGARTEFRGWTGAAANAGFYRGGTSLPGKLLMRLEPHAIGRLAGRLPHGSAVISATNGKTTTAAMVAAILERGGTRLVHNRAGANMAGGVASALLQAARRGAR